MITSADQFIPYLYRNSMNTEARKKRSELIYFELAQSLVNFWPAGKTDNQGEKPDILVNTSDGEYGVEVTELMRGNIRAIESTRKAICSKAQLRFRQHLKLNGLNVHVLFKSLDATFTKPQQDVAAQELCTIISSRLPRIPAEVFSTRLSNYGDFKSDTFNAVYLHYHPLYEHGLWNAVDAWWVPTTLPEHIQAVIDKKEPRVPTYRQRVTPLWLLIVIDGFRGSTSWTVDDTVYSHRYTSTFDGIVLFDRAMNRAHALLTT